MNGSFKDKTVLVIGCDDQVGQKISMAFARMGASVHGWGKGKKGLSRLADEKSLARYLSRFDSGIDVLIVNPSISLFRKPATQISASEWADAMDRMLCVSWKAAVLCVPLLEMKPGASIVFVTSSGVRHPCLDNGVSAVCSAGIESMVKTLSSEVAGRRIRVNAVAVADELFMAAKKDPDGTDDRDISGAVLFLASDSASYCTGSMLEVSGLNVMGNTLLGRSVVITGGTSGIGKAAAEAFLKQGCRVTVCDFRKGPIDEVNRKKDPNLSGVVADVTQRDQIKTLFETVEQQYGGIDVMVNNAGVGNSFGYLTMEDPQWHRVMDINLKAVIDASNQVVPYLKKRGGGVILNVSSLGGRITSTVRSVYGLTKAGVTAYTKVLGAQLAKDNIRVCGVAPGMIKTDMVVVNNRHLKDINVLGSSSVMQRLGETSEIASAMVFLASDRAGHITGEVMEVTGGKCIVQDPSYSWKPVNQYRGKSDSA